MTLLLRPVTKMKCSMPASLASSITCCKTGRSTTQSISFGTDFVAGRNRVPRPATGENGFADALSHKGNPMESELFEKTRLKNPRFTQT